MSYNTKDNAPICICKPHDKILKTENLNHVDAWRMCELVNVSTCERHRVSVARCNYQMRSSSPSRCGWCTSIAGASWWHLFQHGAVASGVAAVPGTIRLATKAVWTEAKNEGARSSHGPAPAADCVFAESPLTTRQTLTTAASRTSPILATAAFICWNCNYKKCNRIMRARACRPCGWTQCHWGGLRLRGGVDAVDAAMAGPLSWSCRRWMFVATMAVMPVYVYPAI